MRWFKTQPSDPVFILPLLLNFKTACDSNLILKRPAIWLFHHYMKEPAKAVVSYRMSVTVESTPPKNIYNLMSSCQLPIGDLRNCWCQCRSWSWQHDIQLVQKYVRQSLLRHFWGEGIKSWTSLWRTKTKGYVPRRITAPDQLLYKKILGPQQTYYPAEFGTLSHLPSQITVGL